MILYALMIVKIYSTRVCLGQFKKCFLINKKHFPISIFRKITKLDCVLEELLE